LSVSLAFLWYNLARNPSVQQKLRQQLATIASRRPKDGSEYTTFSNKDLEELDYLEAIIKESLRVFNPTCNMAPRHTPPEGITIDGTYIPGNVNVFVPSQSIQTCE
jgi:cytochrome P450